MLAASGPTSGEEQVVVVEAVEDEEVLGDRGGLPGARGIEMLPSYSVIVCSSQRIRRAAISGACCSPLDVEAGVKDVV